MSEGARSECAPSMRAVRDLPSRPLEGEASELGGTILVHRSMRAMGTSPAASLNAGEKVASCPGYIYGAPQRASKWAGEKVASAKHVFQG